MGVIINDFEVVAETPSDGAPDPASTQQAPAPAPAPGRRDIGDVVRHQCERAVRLYAG